MKYIRIGNNVNITWTIMRNDQEENLADKALEIYLLDKYNHKQTFEWSVEDNKIKATFYGKDQIHTGIYRLILIENADTTSQVIVEHRECFGLVQKLKNSTSIGDDGDVLIVSYITSDNTNEQYATITWVQEEIDAIKRNTPTKTSELENDSSFVTEETVLEKIEEKTENFVTTTEAEELIKDFVTESDVDDKINDISTQISNNTKQIDNVSIRINDISTKLSDYVTETTFETEINDVKDNIKDISTVLKDVSTKLKTTDTSVNTIETKIKDFVTDTSIDKKLSEYYNKTETNNTFATKSDVSTNISEIKTNITKNTNDISTLSSDVSTNISEIKNDVSTKYNTLNSLITDISTQLSGVNDLLTTI